MNYIIKDEQIYYRIINNNNFLEEFIPVNNLFKIIIFVDEKSLNSIDKSFLNRFEKINLTFDKLMNEEINLLTKKILDEVNLEYFIDKNDKKNYNLKNLLINYGKEEISGLIYSIQTKNKDKKIHDEEIKMKIYYKLTKMLCLDIINCLPNNHILKKIYENEKKYNTLEKYIKDNENKDYKISIIYTFTGITENIENVNESMQLFISEIKCENEFKNGIENIINKQKEMMVIIHFDNYNSNKIEYCINFIDKNFQKEMDGNHKFIFILHVMKNNEKLYSIPDIRDDIYQLFIDNLNVEENIIKKRKKRKKKRKRKRKKKKKRKKKIT